MLAAACAASLALPCAAQEFRSPTTTVFMELPLDAKPREFTPNFGLQFQGNRANQSIRFDQRTFQRLQFLPAIAGIEGVWVVAGAVGLVAVAAVAHKDGATSQQLAQQKQQQAEECPPCAATQ
jgi:hypothetical protein